MLRSFNFYEMGTKTVQYQTNLKYTICLERPTGSCEVSQRNEEGKHHAQFNIDEIRTRLDS
jgi:hypothetical protein